MNNILSHLAPLHAALASELEQAGFQPEPQRGSIIPAQGCDASPSRVATLGKSSAIPANPERVASSPGPKITRGSVAFNLVSLGLRSERDRQEKLHGPNSAANPSMPNSEKLTTLVEEIGEVARAMLDAPEDLIHLRTELIQVAAVAHAWAEAITVTIATHAESQSRQ